MNRAARIEGITQVVILLIMGVMAAAASFKHIHDLAVHNGQPSWIGWVDAVVVELMSIVAGLESRRRKRTGQPTRFVHFVLYGAALISLAAQVAKAAPSYPFPDGSVANQCGALGRVQVIRRTAAWSARASAPPA